MELSTSTGLKLASPSMFFLVCLSRNLTLVGGVEEQRTWGKMYWRPAEQEQGCGSQALGC